MEILGFSIKATLKPNLRVLVIPSLLIVILVVLSAVVFKNGIERISGQMDSLEESKKIENILKDKVEVLRRIEGVVLNQADISALAIPENNPGVLMLSQVSQKAESSGLIVSDGKTVGSSKAQDDMSTMNLLITLEGELKETVTMAKEINDLAPLSTINIVRFTKESGALAMELDLSVYWGDFPTLLPPLTEPIKTLSQNEAAMIADLGILKKPVLVELEASSPTTRENPFR